MSGFLMERMMIRAFSVKNLLTGHQNEKGVCYHYSDQTVKERVI